MAANTSSCLSLPYVYVLMYHSISNGDFDPWEICVSPAYFEEHIQYLKKHYKIISIAELIKQLGEGNITEDAVCITFDDGYADNYLYAKPVLEKYNCAATFFIPSAFINSNKPFWWNALEVIFLHTKKLPGELVLHVSGSNYNYSFDEEELTEEQQLQIKGWKWHKEPPTNRCAAFFDIWNKLRPLAYVKIEKYITILKQWAATDESVFTYCLPMNEQQLLTLCENNLFTVALHTHTHVDLAAANKEIQSAELLQNADELKKNYPIESNCVAYPYGRFNNETLQVVQQLKMAACFTTEAAIINIHSSPYKLGRFQVFNGGTEQFKNLFCG